MILQDTSSSSYLINNPDPLAPHDYPEPILPTANMLKSRNFRNAFFNLHNLLLLYLFYLIFPFSHKIHIYIEFNENLPNKISSLNTLCPSSPLMEFISMLKPNIFLFLT